MPLNEVMYYDNVQEIKKVCIQLVLSISYWLVRVAALGEWSFKDHGSQKIFIEFHRSHRLVVSAVMCISHS